MTQSNITETAPVEIFGIGRTVFIRDKPGEPATEPVEVIMNYAGNDVKQKYVVKRGSSSQTMVPPHMLSATKGEK